MKKPFDGEADTVPLQSGEKSEALNRAGFYSLGKNLRVFKSIGLSKRFSQSLILIIFTLKN